MAIDLQLTPKQKSPAGQPCCEPVVYPDIERTQAERMGRVAKALGDPIRVQLVDSRERGFERRQVGVDVGDHRDAVHERDRIH